MRKENQGIRDAGEFSRVPDFFVVHLSFSVVSGRGILNTPHKTTRQGRSYLSMGRCFYPCRIHVGRIQYAPTLPAEKKPGAQLDSSYASPTLSLLDLRFCPVRLLFRQMDVGIATVAATFFRFLGLLAAARSTATAWFGATAARSATFTFWLLRRVWLFRI